MDSTERKKNKQTCEEKKNGNFTVLVASQWSGKATVNNVISHRLLFPFSLVKGQKVVTTEENDDIHENYALLAKQKNNSGFPL